MILLTPAGSRKGPGFTLEKRDTMAKTFNRKDLPSDFYHAVKAVAPASSRKHKWNVMIADSITIRVTYWDGGSKKEYTATTTDGRLVDLPAARRPGGHFSNPSTWIEPEYQIPAEVIVVECGTFRGKAAAPYLTINSVTAERYGIDV